MRNDGIGSWPLRRARCDGRKPAVVFEDTVFSFADVHERSTRLADALRRLGVARGDRVACLSPNHPAVAETLFACGLVGAIFVPLNIRLAPPELDYILADALPKVLIVSSACAQSAAALRVDPAMIRITVGGAVADAKVYDELLAGSSADPIDEPAGHDDICMIQYTSGTSGRPKGVVLTHGNVVFNCMNLLVDVDLRCDEHNLVVAPMFHTAGLNNSFLTPFMKGGTAILMPAWNADRALALIEHHAVTCMTGVPAIYQSMALSPQWPLADLSSLRTLLVGAAPLPHAVIEAYRARGLAFQQGYGLTETSPNATFLRPDATHKTGSVGTPCFFTDLRIVTEQGREIDAGQAGEVLVQGPNVTPGYWNDPQSTERAFVDGDWLRTGDVARRDGDGHVFIVDRIKDMIISGGENIFPTEVENVLHDHPAIAECAVIGVADARWGEVGRAILFLKRGQDLDESALRGFLSSRLAAYKIPKTFVVTDALPRTASGKILKRDLRLTFGGDVSAATI